jgi:ABC-type lipopolysaccharide export system ATPase subunit
MKGERLTDCELETLRTSSGDDCDMTLVECAVVELRERRARDLSSEERRALELACDVLSDSDHMEWTDPHSNDNPYDIKQRGCTALSKLLGDGEVG